MLNRFLQNKSEFYLIATNLSVPVIGFAANLILTKALIPEELGLYQTILLIPTYLTFLQFGVFSALNRNIPILNGQKNIKKRIEQTNTSFTLSLLLGLVWVIIGFLAYYFLINV